MVAGVGNGDSGVCGDDGGGGLNFSRVQHGFTYVSHYTGLRFSRRLQAYTGARGPWTQFWPVSSTYSYPLFVFTSPRTPGALTLDGVLTRRRSLTSSRPKSASDLISTRRLARHVTTDRCVSDCFVEGMHPVSLLGCFRSFRTDRRGNVAIRETR